MNVLLKILCKKIKYDNYLLFSKHKQEFNKKNALLWWLGVVDVMSELNYEKVKLNFLRRIPIMTWIL